MDRLPTLIVVIVALALVVALAGACDQNEKPAPGESRVNAAKVTAKKTDTAAFCDKQFPVETAPVFEAPALADGGKLPASTKWRWVNVWATWCKPCLKEIPDLSKVYEKYKARGLVMLGIMTDDPDHNQLLNFQSDNEMTYPVVRVNSDILVSYSYPGALPTTFVYDRSGKQVYSHVGPLRVEQLERLLEPLMAN